MATPKEGNQEGSEETPWNPLVVNHGFYSPIMSGSIDGTDSTPHDKAIRKTLKANYKMSKRVDGDPEKTLFVARLSHRTTQDVLRNAFAKYGDVNNCHLVRDFVTGRSMGYGFVEFSRADDAENAYEQCHEMYLDGSQLIIDYEYERLLPGWVPRRLGGGVGGKKESGQLRFGGRDRPFRKPIVLGRHGTSYRDRDFGRPAEREPRRLSRDEDNRESHRHPQTGRREDGDRHRHSRRSSQHSRNGQSSNRQEYSRHDFYRSRRSHRSRSRSR